MELLIVTAVSSYEDDIKKLLKKTGVMAYSHMNVNGYKELPPEEQEGNWFATSVGEHRSALFYAFVEESKVDGVLQAMTDFNNQQDTESHIHAVVVDVKKSSN
jgi:hypothetical protein